MKDQDKCDKAIDVLKAWANGDLNQRLCDDDTEVVNIGDVCGLDSNQKKQLWNLSIKAGGGALDRDIPR